MVVLMFLIILVVFWLMDVNEYGEVLVDIDFVLVYYEVLSVVEVVELE